MADFWISFSNGCWIEVYDAGEMKGHCCRLVGPAEFRNLRIGEEEWGDQVQSLMVGPHAYVQCFEDEYFEDQGIWLLPNQRIVTIDALRLKGDVDSIRVFDRPPFGHERGYASYIRSAAEHLAILHASAAAAVTRKPIVETTIFVEAAKVAKKSVPVKASPDYV
jgi:hypothetical protein